MMKRNNATTLHARMPKLFCKFGSVVIAFSLAFSVTFAAPLSAAADVRKADIVVEETVESRGLTLAECPSIECEYAALMNSEGEIYYSRNGNSTTQIASITKVMTAIIVLDNAPDDITITVSKEAATIGESTANLEEGDVLDLDAALKALLVPSGNDAAYALAECVGAEILKNQSGLGNNPIKAFVTLMNRKAEELGCTNTIYDNPHGLDDESYAGPLRSTALDQTRVARCAMTYPEIREIVSHGNTTIKVKRDGKTEEIELETTDELLEMYEYAIGIKTGSTDLAGPSFMAAASKEGRELYAVILNSENEERRFRDARALFEWYYDHVKVLPLAQSTLEIDMIQNGTTTTVPVVAEVTHADWMDRTVKATLRDPEATLSVFDLEGNVTQTMIFDDIRGTIKPGDKVGTVTYRQKNMVIAEQDLVAAERVEGPNPLEAISIMWQRFLAGFNGEPTQAESRVYNIMPIIDNNRTSAS